MVELYDDCNFKNKKDYAYFCLDFSYIRVGRDGKSKHINPFTMTDEDKQDLARSGYFNIDGKWVKPIHYNPENITPPKVDQANVVMAGSPTVIKDDLTK